MDPGPVPTIVPPKATRREWLGLAVIALPCMLYSMDLTVLNLAVPKLTADLKPSSAELLWIMDIYGFFVAGSLITMGTLGDRIGRRRMLLIGAAAFGVTSVLAAFSTTAPLLILSRALLGISGATLAPSTLSLIRAMFLDEKQRSVAISIWITSYSVGGAIGPFAGGILLEHFWWGSVFLAGVPVMVLLLILGPLLLPEYRDEHAGKLDIPSAALSLSAVLSIIYGLKQLAQGGAWWLALATVALGVALGTVFLRRQRHLKDPFIDLALLQRPAFRSALTLNVLAFFLMFPMFLFISQYLQLVMGLSPLRAGLWMLPSSVGFVIGSLITPGLAGRLKRGHLLAGGLLLSSIGFVVLSQALQQGSLVVMVATAFFYSLGVSPVVMLATDLILGAAPPERAGAAASLSETSAEFGGALGIAVLGSVGTAIYRGAMQQPSLEGVPPELAAQARDTLGAAMEATQHIGDAAVATGLAEHARLAFTDAAGWAALIVAGGTFLLAVFTLFMHRGKGPAQTVPAT